MNAPVKRPQLTLDELQQLKWLLGGVLTLLALWTVFYMDVPAWTLMGLTSVATIATMLWPTLPARIPSIAHTLAFPAIVIFFVADIWIVNEVLPAMVRLDILLLLYRNLTYRQRRDDLQIVVLGLFLVIIAGVLTVSLTFAAHLLIYTACALAFLLVLTLSEGMRSVAHALPLQDTKEIGAAPTWAVHADWRRLSGRLRQVTDWRVVGLGAALFAGVVVVSGLLFLAIPRFQLENSMFLDRFISKKSRSGFSETIRFGHVTEIQQDNSVALSVDISDPAKMPPMPYWRMLVLDQYRDGTFRMSVEVRAREFEKERVGASVAGWARAKRGVTVWTFYLESGVSRYLPLLGHFERLRFREAQNFRVSRSLALLALRQEPVTMTAYQVEDFDLSGAVPDPEFAQRWRTRISASEHGEPLPARSALGETDHAVLARLMREAAGEGAVSAAEFAEKTSAWLRRNHSYTLAPRIPNGAGDPLVRWLASNEAGHCELFAGSFVLLAHAAGFPARIVTGFKGGTWNAFSNNFTVRNADAHAWAEIFDEVSGAWLRADPLEASAAAQADAAGGQAALERRMDRSWAARLDSLRVFWYRRIVSFDQRSQAETLKAVKDATQNSGQRLRAAIDRAARAIKAWFTAPWDTRRWMTVLGAILAGAATVAWWRSAGRAWWRTFTRARGARGVDPVRREAGRLLAALRMEANGDADVESQFGAVVSDLQRLRFGARETWPEAEKVFRRARRVAREARRRERVTPTAAAK